jgi:hypothetical protein
VEWAKDAVVWHKDYCALRCAPMDAVTRMFVSALLLSNGWDLAWVFQDELGIDARVVPADAEEKMRSRGAAGGSDAAERMALLDLLAGLDLDIGKVEIHANETVAVIDEHGVALEEQIFGDDHRPVGHR